MALAIVLSGVAACDAIIGIQNPQVQVDGSEPVDARVSEDAEDATSSEASPVPEEGSVVTPDAQADARTSVPESSTPDRPLWAADFTVSFPTGKIHSLSAVVPQLGLARASVATVQTSISTVTSDVGVDEARVGSPQAGVQGLVVEEARTNWVASSRNCATSNYVVSPPVDGGAVNPYCAMSPDTTYAASCIKIPSGTLVQETIVPQGPTTATTTASLWGYGNPMQWSLGSWGVAACSSDITSSAWSRSVLPPTPLNPGGMWMRAAMGYGQDSTIGGSACVPGAVNEVVDFLQVETGSFATEAIITNASTQTRAGDLLWIVDGAGAVDRGQLSLYLQMVPKGASRDYASPMYLWSIDSGNYAVFEPATQSVVVAVGGSVPVHGAAADAGASADGGALPIFPAGSAVEWFVRTGAGTCLVEYRVAGGPVRTLLEGNCQGNVAPASPDGGLAQINLLSHVDPVSGNRDGQFSSWLQTVAVYPQGSAPAGF